ncbi:unnamed protein product, partial [Arctogadus glacialis]
WEMRSPVLQTRPLYESHTGSHLAQVLTQAVEEWKIKRPTTKQKDKTCLFVLSIIFLFIFC